MQLNAINLWSPSLNERFGVFWGRAKKARARVGLNEKNLGSR